MPVDGQRDMATRLIIAGLVGLATGLEREWSGHASGRNARFAGLRTFCLLGLLGGVAGILAATAQFQMATAFVAGGAALCVVCRCRVRQTCVFVATKASPTSR